MTELIIHIHEEKESLIKELVKQLGGNVVKGKKAAGLRKELRTAIREVRDIKKGKLKAKDAEEFLNELRS